MAMSNMVSPTPRKRSAKERIVGSDIRVVSTLKNGQANDRNSMGHVSITARDIKQETLT